MMQTTQKMSFQDASLAVKNRLDIVEIISRHVALRKAGRNFLGLCPFHQEKTPSFNVNASKQLFKCFGCGEGGDALSFLMKLEHKTYGQLIEELARDMGIEIQEEGRRAETKAQNDSLYHLQVVARQFFEHHLAQAPDVQQYLANRQITPEIQRLFGIGYAPKGWDNFVTYALKHDSTAQQKPDWLEKAGLANLRQQEGQGYYDRFRNRLMIPIMDDRGRVVAFGGRALDPEDNPKYLNSPETAIYLKSRVLYGIAQAKDSIRDTAFAIVMEGYFDVISAHIAGLTQAVGVCGTALTEDQLKLMLRHGAETLYLCFDSDEAGQKAALRAIEQIETSVLAQGIQVRVIRLPGEKDPDDFLKANGKEAFMTAMQQAQDFLTFKFDRLLAEQGDYRSPQGRIKAVQRLLPVLAAISQPLVRREQLKRLAEQLMLDEETLLIELKRYENDNFPYSNKKNFQSRAISKISRPYISSRQRNDIRNAQEQLESVFLHPRLSENQAIERKENELMNFLLLSPESHRLVMDQLATVPLQSPMAQRLVYLVQSVSKTWTTIDELLAALQEQLHQTGDEPMQRYLTDRVMSLDHILESYKFVSEGLQSADYRAKLNRVISAIMQNLCVLQRKMALKSLVNQGREFDQTENDQSGLEAQLLLREALSGPSDYSPQGVQCSLHKARSTKE